MFHIHLVMHVWDSYSLESSDNWISVHKEIDLPFSPFIGLEIGLPSQRPWKVTGVIWDTEAKVFRCNLHDLFCELGVDELTFEEWAEHFKEDAWTSIGPHPKSE